MFRKALVILICLVFSSTVAFAGAIPESLKLGNQQALFIGKITGEDSDSYTLMPLTIMMGSIKQEEITVERFDRYYGTTDIPAVGDYLVAVLVEDKKIDDLWVFKATSADYKTLELVSEKYDMVERYQEYINNGDYFVAQQRLLEQERGQNNASAQTEMPQPSNNFIKDPESLYPALLFIFMAVGTYLFYVFVLRRMK